LPASAADPQPGLADWLADPFFQESNALGQLLQRWRPGESFRASSCGHLAADLHCLRLASGWDRLLRQNLPTVLSLKLTDGRERSVALVAANEHRATLLDREGKPITFPVREVLPLWTGDSLIVWAPLANRTTYLAPGMSHPSIPMLRQQLTAAGFAAVPVGPVERFDEPLEKSVLSFQRAVGIRADGIIGPETLVGLAAVMPQPGVPSLRETPAPE
jgi:general secretion pathway protein A